MRSFFATGLCILLLVSALGSVDSQLHGAEGAEHMQQSGEFLVQGGATVGEAGHGLESEGLAGESLEHHGEAAEGEGEGEGHHKVDNIQKTTSYLLIGFMVTNFVMLWLVTYPDANIRSYTWKMMSSTISIYLAVLLNNAIRDFSLHAVLGTRCKEGSECANDVVDHKIELVIRFTLFAVAFSLTNILCYIYGKGSGRWMHAAQVLSGHITAFAGIELFSNLTQTYNGVGFLWSAFTFISLTLVGFRFASGIVRASMFGPEGKVVQTYVTASGIQQQEIEAEEWREAVCEAEDDGCSIFMSYMLKVLVMTHLFGHGYHKILEEHTIADLQKLLVAQLSFIGALVALTYWRRSLDHGNHEEEENATSAYTRSMNCLNIVLAMSMSWLSLQFFYCLTMKLFPGISEEFDEIVSAAILTGSAIVGILVLDRFADKVEEVAHEEAELLSGHIKVGPEAQRPIHHVSNLEKAIRSIINSFALAVGLSWEKAFHAALDTVIESNPAMDKHYVISEGLLAFVNCVLIVPVWLSLIVPQAKKSLQDHKTMMQVAAQQG